MALRRSTEDDPSGQIVQSMKDGIVRTVQKCITIIHLLAANSLPEPARPAIRNAVLRLPSSWIHYMSSADLPLQEVASVSASLGLAVAAHEMIRCVCGVFNEVLDRSSHLYRPMDEQGAGAADEPPNNLLDAEIDNL